MDRIGVIGLGRMGSAIATRMAEAGQEVTGWTRSGRAAEGVPLADSIAAVAAASDALILSLFDDAAVEEVLDALLQADLTGKIIIETSTVTPATVQSRAEAMARAGAAVVDAPISGGPELVAAGQCGIFIGGAEADAARAGTVLAPLSGRIFHLGPLGAGYVMKAINNSMLQHYFQGLHEMLPLARQAGMALEDVLRILSGGPAGMPMVRDRIPKILGEDDTVGFAISGGLKDNVVFQRILADHGLTSPGLEAVERRMRQIVGEGLGDRDPALMVRRAYDRG